LNWAFSNHCKGNPPKRDICLELAREQLERILPTRDDVIAAYSDGSVARDDMIPGSDIDIAIVIEKTNEPGRVWRIIEKENDILIEWAFIPKTKYENVEKILEDAGFTQDIVHSYIHYDPRLFIGSIKEQVLARYKERDGIFTKALNQLKKVEKGVEDIESGLKNRNEVLVQKNIAFVMKCALGFPCATLNRPLTHSRGFLFCKEACWELKVPEYNELVLEFMGSSNLHKKDVEKLLGNAKEILKSDRLILNEKVTYLYHLHTAHYFIDTGLWKEAAWPIFMWTQLIVLEELQQRKGKDSVNVERFWLEMLQILKWVSWKDIRNKTDVGKKIVKLGFTILNQI